MPLPRWIQMHDGERWLHTGDLGYLDEDGYVFIVDRKKDLIKPSGFQVWPREVEEVLSQHPAVQEAAVAGIPDTYKGEAVAAWIVLKAGMVATVDRFGPSARSAWPRTRCLQASSSTTPCPRRWSARSCDAAWWKSTNRRTSSRLMSPASQPSVTAMQVRPAHADEQALNRHMVAKARLEPNESALAELLAG